MKRRILFILVIAFAILFFANICLAQEGGSVLIPVPIDTDEDDDDSSDDSIDGTSSETGYEKQNALSVEDAMLRKVAKIEAMTDEDGNFVVYYYNKNDQILEKVIYICPPKELLDKIFDKKLAWHNEAYPVDYYGWRLSGTNEPVYEVEFDGEIEIRGINEFDGEVLFIEDGAVIDEDTSEEISIGVFDEDSGMPINMNVEGDGSLTEPTDDIEIKEFDENVRYFEDDGYKSPLEKELGSDNLDREKVVNTLLERYTIWTPDQSLIENLLVRETANYDAGRITIVISQGIKINFKAKTYTCDFSHNYDSYHYLNGILVTKFDIRKGTYKVAKYDPETGILIGERIHQSRAGNSYDLWTYYDESGALGWDIYHGGSLAYYVYADDPNPTIFGNINLTFDMSGKLLTKEEMIFKDYEEAINENIVNVDFHLSDIDRSERAPYSEIGIKKEYYDHWEMITQVEIYYFGGNRTGKLGKNMNIDGGIAIIRYYGLNGMLFREERYDNNKLFSTVVINYSEDGDIERINFVDAFGNIYKYKEGGSFYSATGNELTEEAFIKVSPEYDFGFITTEYVTEDGKTWIVGDDFYTNLEKYILGYTSEYSASVEDIDDSSDDDSDDDEVEEGLGDDD